MAYRLAIVSTHPIQYHTPWYQALSKHPAIDLTVYFCHNATPKEQADAGFGVEFEWDTALLEGYEYRFLKNVARNPSISHFFGLDTPEIEAIFTQEHFDAVIVSGWTYKAAWQTFRACWKTKTPVMVRGDSHLYTQRSLPKQVLKYPFYRWFLGKMDACLAVGEWSRDYYLHYGVPPQRVFFVPHTVDEAHFSQTKHVDVFKRSAWREERNLPKDAIMFLFCGKLIEKKRPLDFVRAIGIANKSNNKVRGMIVGDGPLRVTCEQMSRNESIPIHLLGFLNQVELPNTYAASDCIVLPSDGGETWGLVINEAMLSGLPAIVSDQVGCWPDLIIPSVTGDIFPMGQVEQLAEKMISLANDPEQLATMGQQARTHIKENYSIEQAVSGVVEALEFVVKKANV